MLSSLLQNGRSEIFEPFLSTLLEWLSLSDSLPNCYAESEIGFVDILKIAKILQYEQ